MKLFLAAVFVLSSSSHAIAQMSAGTSKEEILESFRMFEVSIDSMHADGSSKINRYVVRAVKVAAPIESDMVVTFDETEQLKEMRIEMRNMDSATFFGGLLEGNEEIAVLATRSVEDKFEVKAKGIGSGSEYDILMRYFRYPHILAVYMAKAGTITEWNEWTLPEANSGSMDQGDVHDNTQSFTIPEGIVAMEPTIKPGDRVWANNDAYLNTEPKRWDVVLFTPPVDNYKWIMRIVGLPGETIDIREGSIYINGVMQQLPPHLLSIRYVDDPDNNGKTLDLPYAIPAGSYFILGDNSTESWDSRFWGPVLRANIHGKVEGK